MNKKKLTDESLELMKKYVEEDLDINIDDINEKIHGDNEISLDILMAAIKSSYSKETPEQIYQRSYNKPNKFVMKIKEKVIKETHFVPEPLTLEILTKDIEEFYNKKSLEEKIPKLPSIKHCKWEEDGKKYSSWIIDTGKSILRTGDGGMELFIEALEKQLKNELPSS